MSEEKEVGSGTTSDWRIHNWRNRITASTGSTASTGATGATSTTGTTGASGGTGY